MKSLTLKRFQIFSFILVIGGAATFGIGYALGGRPYIGLAGAPGSPNSDLEDLLLGWGFWTAMASLVLLCLSLLITFIKSIRQGKVSKFFLASVLVFLILMSAIPIKYAYSSYDWSTDPPTRTDHVAIYPYALAAKKSLSGSASIPEQVSYRNTLISATVSVIFYIIIKKYKNI